MTFRERLRAALRMKADLAPVVRWAGRWLLPVFFYGLGLGMLLPIMNRWVGWDVYTAGGSDDVSEYFETQETRCLTNVSEEGVIESELCVTKGHGLGYSIGETSFVDISEFLIPVRLVVGLVVLFIAYRLTPKA